jgi:NAD+ diphosphatase
MIQDIHPHIFENIYTINVLAQNEDYIFYFSDNTVLLKENNNILEIPRKKDFISIDENQVHLFKLNKKNCFWVEHCEFNENEHFKFIELSTIRKREEKEVIWTSILANQLRTWYHDNKFCGKCGTPTQHSLTERAIVCPNCKNTIYPKISPAIIVAIVSKTKILLANNANFMANWYSLVAGYTEVGETLEHCVAREVKEEIGIDVKNITYYKSQPWPVSGSLMVGFIAEADENQPITIDNKEITHASWFERGKLPNHPLSISIAGELIDLFEKGEIYKFLK